MNQRKKIALVAHRTKKQDLLEWARCNRALLLAHKLYASATTGALLERELGIDIHKLQKGEIVRWAVTHASERRSRVDLVVFFWHQPELLPHDPEERAILRLAALWNIPVACNRASADCMIPSLVQGVGFTALSAVPW